MTVHMLKSGLAVCGAGMPNDWPDGDRWVAYNNKSDRGSINCQGCLNPPEISAPQDAKQLPSANQFVDAELGWKQVCMFLVSHPDTCFCIAMRHVESIYRFGVWAASHGPGKSATWAELMGPRPGGMQFGLGPTVPEGFIQVVPLFLDPHEVVLR